MEEVYSWWEVPAVAHFCYVFRSPFNLFFFEIAELESALLNIQDPDMSMSLDQLVTRLLQGCYDEESVNEGNFEEKLHELFNDNFEDEESLFDDSSDFYQLSPRAKIQVLLKLCELRLDVEGALDDIKNIPSEDMQAKCIGKDSLNNTYWYFCDERLYKENNSKKKVAQPSNTKDLKNNYVNSRQSTREKRSKTSLNIDESWTVACFNVSDWEKLLQSFSKSKSVHEKNLSGAIKKHLPLLQERVSEKARLLRKRFLELAPKRSSSRISRVQEKKKLEEMKAEEEARKAKLEADKAKAKKEALLLKQKKESRQKRAEERWKLMEERAAQSQEDSEDEDEIPECSFRRTRKRTEAVECDCETTKSNTRCYLHTHSNVKQTSSKSGGNLKNGAKNSQFNQISDASEESDAGNTINSEKRSRTRHITQNIRGKFSSNESCSEDSCNSSNASKRNIKTYSSVKTEDSSSKQSSLNLPNNYSNSAHGVINKTLPSRVAIYKSNVLQNASDVSKWNAAFGSKGQKLKILHNSYANVASKKIKLEGVNLKTVSPNMKLSKENHMYKPVQTAFITYGKIIPTPAIVKLEYRKPPNQEVSS